MRPRELSRCAHWVQRYGHSPGRACGKTAHFCGPHGLRCKGHSSGRPADSAYLHAPGACHVCDRVRKGWREYDEIRARELAASTGARS